MRRALGAAVVGLLVCGSAGAAALSRGTTSHPVRTGARAAVTSFPASAPPPGRVHLRLSPPSRPTTTPAPSTTSSTSTSTTAAAPATKAVLAGCPVPPHPPLPPSPPPWHPAVLVPAGSLPAVVAPAPWKSDVTALDGKGMWIWEWDRTDGGDATSVVAQAARSGLHQLWVRVADSKDGFYGGAELQALVPAAHARGLKVIAWGFPYLYDPVADAGWTAQVLDWKSTGGQTVDGFSADIEEPSEGVALSAQRAGVYLEYARRAAGSRLLVATVYPPSDYFWTTGQYPYSVMAHYVDAFAPMIYWGCTDPGTDATIDVRRLGALRPVTVIGQAYNMASEAGRPASPSPAEITEFLQASRAAGAVGASFWVWQSATADEWGALAGYPWPG